MPHWFNTAGPCKPDVHYMLSAQARLPAVRPLIEQLGYFVLHAPRQVGKTTSLLALGHELTAEGRYAALLVSAEVGSPFAHDPGAAELAMLASWRESAGWQLPPSLQPPPWPDAPPGQRIGSALRAWVQASPRPLIIFIDEIDALRDEALISVLRQLRSGYPGRPGAFPWSLALVGLRDVRDYKISLASEGRLGSSSPFNIKIKSLLLRDFSADEVAELYGQHSAETGQAFEPSAIERAFELTRGQPWLVNALAKEAVEEIVPDRTRAITHADIERAKEALIARQDTHLDSLIERLREPRVRQIIEPLLAGRMLGDVPDDDLRFVQDLGLVRKTSEGGLEVSNPIYREVIPRALAATAMASMPRIKATWLTARGTLDVEALLEAFLAFWCQHGEALLATAPYAEIAPHLVLMAFLHRVVNGGGTLEREYAIGRDRMDLCLRYGGATLGIELKVWRDSDKKRDPALAGLAQLDEYLAGLGAQAIGWLVVFDQREGLPPVAERTTAGPATTPAGRPVTVVRA
jgi:hypothetical protein